VDSMLWRTRSTLCPDAVSEQQHCRQKHFSEPPPLEPAIPSRFETRHQVLAASFCVQTTAVVLCAGFFAVCSGRAWKCEPCTLPPCSTRATRAGTLTGGPTLFAGRNLCQCWQSPVSLCTCVSNPRTSAAVAVAGAAVAQD
jgi:hypothetical protein